MRILPKEPQNLVSRDNTWVIFSWAFSLQQLDILLLKPLQKISSCPIIIIVEAVKVILSEKTSLSSRHDQSAILIVTFSATLLQYQKYQSVKRRREA